MNRREENCDVDLIEMVVEAVVPVRDVEIVKVDRG